MTDGYHPDWDGKKHTRIQEPTVLVHYRDPPEFGFHKLERQLGAPTCNCSGDLRFYIHTNDEFRHNFLRRIHQLKDAVNVNLA